MAAPEAADIESFRAESLRAHNDLRAQQNLHIVQIAALASSIARVEDRQAVAERASEERDAKILENQEKLHEKLLANQEKLLSAYETGKIWARVIRYIARMVWLATIGIGGYVLAHWGKVKAFMDGK